MLSRIVTLLCIIWVASSSGIASEITCLYPHRTTQPIPPSPSNPLVIPGVDPHAGQCIEAAINGPIASGDAQKLAKFLARESSINTIYLFSPGGNLVEGMKLGRLIRANFLRTKVTPPSRVGEKNSSPRCGVAGQPVCCASACALAYFGGIGWSRADFLGLHRPTLQDLGDLSYSEVQQALQEAAVKIKEYIAEMEIDESFYTLMMSAAPNRIAIVPIDPDYPRNGEYKYPPSVYDWLQAKCHHKIRRPATEMQTCIWDALTAEQRNRRRAANEWTSNIDKHIRSMPTPDLERRVADLSKRVAAGERLTLDDYEFLDAGRKRLEQTHLLERKDEIDRMSIDELRKYARGYPAYNAVRERVYKRLVELTGDTVIGDPSVDCGWAKNPDAILSSCTIVIERGDADKLRQRAVAHGRRADVYSATMRDHDRAIADYTKAIDLRLRMKNSPDPGFFDQVDLNALYASRARAFERKGDFDAAISDYTKLIELESDNWSLGLYHIERGRLYEKKGDKAGAIANYRKLLQIDPSSQYARQALARLGATP